MLQDARNITDTSIDRVVPSVYHVHGHDFCHFISRRFKYSLQIYVDSYESVQDLEKIINLLHIRYQIEHLKAFQAG